MGERTYTHIVLIGDEPNVLGTSNEQTFIGRQQQKLYITEDQKQLIEMFADTEKDENLGTYYFINKVKFRITLNLEKQS